MLEHELTFPTTKLQVKQMINLHHCCSLASSIGKNKAACDKLEGEKERQVFSETAEDDQVCEQQNYKRTISDGK